MKRRVSDDSSSSSSTLKFINSRHKRKEFIKTISMQIFVEKKEGRIIMSLSIVAEAEMPVH